MEIVYYGHSALQLNCKNTSIIIDPLISRNPTQTANLDDIKVEYILLSHGHHDHFGDTLSIAKRNDATVIAPYELAIYLRWKGLKTHPLGIDGSKKFDFGRVKLTYARHSSSYMDFEKQEITYMGPPGGFLLDIEGKTIYFSGDTGLFGDMKLIGERNKIDAAFLPIGNNYTMGIDDAVQAAEWIGAKKTIPVHYNSFPFLDQDPNLFISGLKEKGLEGVILTPGSKMIV